MRMHALVHSLAHLTCALMLALAAGTPAPAAENAAQPGTEAHIEAVQAQAALAVTDKNCPAIVQPYELTGNATSLTTLVAKQHTARLSKKVAGRVTQWLGLGSGNQAQPTPDANSDGSITAATRLEAKRLNWLPMSAEVAYGERSHAAQTAVLDRDSKLGAKYYPTADRILAEILGRITEKHDYEFKLFILKNSTRNAIARPGGYLYLDQGLIQDPTQLSKAYFALAHELAHVLQRHETQELQGMVIDSFTTTEQLLEVLPKASNDPAVILQHVRVGKEVYLRHHMDQELQADSCAARLLGRVYPERATLAQSLNAFLAELPPIQPDLPRPAPQTDEERLAATLHELVATPANRHPNSLERTQNLTTVYQEIIAPPALDAGAKAKPMLSAN